MRQMKRLFLSVFRLLYWCGIPGVFRFFHRHSLTIVLYHGVAPEVENGIYNYRGKFIRPDVFERQVAYMKKHYTILPVDEALRRLDDGTLPDYALAITFDDGYRNFYEHAYPVLKASHTPATMYLATDFVCRNVPLWVDRLEFVMGTGAGSFTERTARDARTRDHLKSVSPDVREAALVALEKDAGTSLSSFDGERAVYAPLTRAEIIELAENGITFGAHTKSHPILARQSSTQQRDEILGSKSDIESIGVPVSLVFAYPNGQSDDWNSDTERILETSGFTHALTTHEGANTHHSHPYRIRRFALDNTDDTAAFANILTGVRLFVKSQL